MSYGQAQEHSNLCGLQRIRAVAEIRADSRKLVATDQQLIYHAARYCVNRNLRDVISGRRTDFDTLTKVNRQMTNGVFTSAVAATPAVQASGTNAAEGISASSDTGAGVSGTSASGNGGVFSSSGAGNGVVGTTGNGNANGVAGINTATGTGVQGSSVSGNAVAGTSKTGNGGVFSSEGAGNGVHGASWTGPGVGGNSLEGNGGLFSSTSGTGIAGTSQSGVGVLGDSTSNWGIGGTSQSGAGVVGRSTSNNGVAGYSTSGNGVAGESTSGTGLWAKGTPAGYFEGNVTVTGTLTVGVDIVLTAAADFAEEFDLTGTGDAEPGTVMVLDGEEGAVKPSCLAYDRKVAGIISGGGEYKPGIVLDKRASNRPRKALALVGKVYCKVDADYAPVAIGDMLTTSPTRGHAMKASDPLQAFGAVIGKALRPLKSGHDLVPILVALQ